MALLSLDQTDSNLLRDFRWVARQTRKFPRKYTQVAKKKKNQGYGLSSRGQYPVFHWLIGCYNNEWTSRKWH